MKEAGCGDALLQSWFTPEADAQVSSVRVKVKELQAQVEGLAFLRVPPLPHRLNAPHVVEDVQLGGSIRQKNNTMTSEVKGV